MSSRSPTACGLVDFAAGPGGRCPQEKRAKESLQQTWPYHGSGLFSVVPSTPGWCHPFQARLRVAPSGLAPVLREVVPAARGEHSQAVGTGAARRGGAGRAGTALGPQGAPQGGRCRAAGGAGRVPCSPATRSDLPPPARGGGWGGAAEGAGRVGRAKGEGAARGGRAWVPGAVPPLLRAAPAPSLQRAGRPRALPHPLRAPAPPLLP